MTVLPDNAWRSNPVDDGTECGLYSCGMCCRTWRCGAGRCTGTETSTRASTSTTTSCPASGTVSRAPVPPQDHIVRHLELRNAV
jgi:hypothetical protein